MTASPDPAGPTVLELQRTLERILARVGALGRPSGAHDGAAAELLEVLKLEAEVVRAELRRREGEREA